MTIQSRAVDKQLVDNQYYQPWLSTTTIASTPLAIASAHSSIRQPMVLFDVYALLWPLSTIYEPSRKPFEFSSSFFPLNHAKPPFIVSLDLLTTKIKKDHKTLDMAVRASSVIRHDCGFMGTFLGFQHSQWDYPWDDLLMIRDGGSTTIGFGEPGFRKGNQGGYKSHAKTGGVHWFPRSPFGRPNQWYFSICFGARI